MHTLCNTWNRNCNVCVQVCVFIKLSQGNILGCLVKFKTIFCQIRRKNGFYCIAFCVSNRVDVWIYSCLTLGYSITCTQRTLIFQAYLRSLSAGSQKHGIWLQQILLKMQEDSQTFWSVFLNFFQPNQRCWWWIVCLVDIYGWYICRRKSPKGSVDPWITDVAVNTDELAHPQPS